MPPMPARVAAIKAAIETRQDFSVLAHGGEDAVAAWARTHGLNGRGLILEWQQNYRLAQARQVSPQSAGKPPRPAPIETELRLDDLDYWSDTEPEPDDDDDGDDVPCPTCNGRGRDAAGNRCAVCNGSGRVAPEDNEDEDDDDEDQDE
jgi:hypothetical protein